MASVALLLAAVRLAALQAALCPRAASAAGLSAALSHDNECPAGGDECALSLRQLRRQTQSALVSDHELDANPRAAKTSTNLANATAAAPYCCMSAQGAGYIDGSDVCGSCYESARSKAGGYCHSTTRCKSNACNGTWCLAADEQKAQIALLRSRDPDANATANTTENATANATHDEDANATPNTTENATANVVHDEAVNATTNTTENMTANTAKYEDAVNEIAAVEYCCMSAQGPGYLNGGDVCGTCYAPARSKAGDLCHTATECGGRLCNGTWCIVQPPAANETANLTNETAAPQPTTNLTNRTDAADATPNLTNGTAAAAAPYCCMSAQGAGYKDSSDMCGTCYASARAKVGSLCDSAAKCESGTCKGMWCDAAEEMLPGFCSLGKVPYVKDRCDTSEPTFEQAKADSFCAAKDKCIHSCGGTWCHKGHAQAVAPLRSA